MKGFWKARRRMLRANNIDERVDRMFWIAIAVMSGLFGMVVISEIVRF